MIGAHHAVTGVYRGAFDNGQDVALHALAGDVGAMAAFAPGDLVDFINEDDAHLLGALGGDARHVIHVDELIFFILNQVIEGLGRGHLSFLLLLAEKAGKHVLDVDVHLLDALVRDDLERGHGALAHLDFDHALVEFAFPQLDTELVAGAVRFAARVFGLGLAGRRAIHRNGRRWEQQVEQALFSSLFGALGNFVELFLADHVDGGLDQVAHHRFDVAADVANLGVLRRFDLDERAARQTSQPARDFRFTDAGGTDHQNIFWQNLFGQLGGKLLPAHAIAQSDGHGALGSSLADDILVELDHDFARGQLVK